MMACPTHTHYRELIVTAFFYLTSMLSSTHTDVGIRIRRSNYKIFDVIFPKTVSSKQGV